MGGLRRRRLERLERRATGRIPRTAGEPTNEEEGTKERWLARAKSRRYIAIEGGLRAEEAHARDVFRLFRSRRQLPETAEELRAALLAWRPPPDTRAIGRWIARAIRDGEEGTEGMECPPEWRESFEAADELLGRYMAAPAEDLARIYVVANDRKEGRGDERPEEWLDAEMDRLGITVGLEERAIGPDVGEIPEEETTRRLMEALGDYYYGEKGYEVQQHITRLTSEMEG